MTTITEADIRLGGDGSESLPRTRAGLDAILADPVLAQRLARKILASGVLAELDALELSMEDLRDVLEVACRGPRQEEIRILEGRYFRKRLREQVALSERYGDSFAVVVLALGITPNDRDYEKVLNAVTTRLRSTDMLFLYKKRFAVILPRMTHVALAGLLSRVSQLVSLQAGPRAVETIASIVFPDPEYADTQAVLDWAEDQLREF